MAERLKLHGAVFVLLERDGKIFMLRRANTGWADGMWTIPSGHIDPGQTALEAACVEAREEAGIIVKPEDLEFVHTHYVFDAYVNYYFRAKHWEGEPILGEPELCSEIAWCDIDALPNNTIMHVKSMLKSVINGEYFSDIPNDPNPS